MDQDAIVRIRVDNKVQGTGSSLRMMYVHLHNSSTRQYELRQSSSYPHGPVRSSVYIRDTYMPTFHI